MVVPDTKGTTIRATSESRESDIATTESDLMLGPRLTPLNTRDVVVYQGESFIAIHDNIGTIPREGSVDWQIIVRRASSGVMGATGATGPAGPPGAGGSFGSVGTSVLGEGTNDGVSLDAARADHDHGRRTDAVWYWAMVGA